MSIVQLVDNTVAEHETRDPFVICQSLGIIIQRHPLAELRGFFRFSNGYPVIVLNEKLEGTTAHFVCAHELGHFLLHKRMNRAFMDASTRMETSRFENEADKFAAHLLYGEPPLYQEAYLTDEEMAECLNVPVDCVMSRMMELGVYPTSMYFGLAKGLEGNGIHPNDIYQIMQIAKRK